MDSNFIERAQEYLGGDGMSKKLGSGEEGFVWSTTRKSAIKVFEREKNYNIELSCYQILKQNGVETIEGFNIPQLLGFDDDLMVVEMSVVSAPYILDFGKAYFSPPDYPSDAVAQYEERCVEAFGEYWATVQAAIYDLKQMGIWYVDANRRNINCDGLRPESPG